MTLVTHLHKNNLGKNMLVDPNLGKKTSQQADVQTYCDVTGLTRSNGEAVKTDSICRAINEKTVSFEEINKPIDMSTHKITNLEQSPLPSASTLATVGWAKTFLFLNSINPGNFQPGEILSINPQGNGLTPIKISEIRNKIGLLI